MRYIVKQPLQAKTKVNNNNNKITIEHNFFKINCHI